MKEDGVECSDREETKKQVLSSEGWRKDMSV